MILDVPTEAYYKNKSLSLLHLSASIVYELFPNNKYSAHDDEIIEEYWSKCQPALSNALTIIQQAMELGLKGCIAAISPYLLISREPRDWPRQCAMRDTSFATFRSIDAADLLRVTDVVCNSRLSDEAKHLYEEVRSHRNLIVHHGSAQSLTAAILIKYILKTHRWLHGENTWFTSRYNYLEDDQLATLYSPDHVSYKINTEFGHIFDCLDPSDFLTLIGANKKTRWYKCKSCDSLSDGELENSTAKLVPNTPVATCIRCVVCDEENRVLRQKCLSAACKGNVFQQTHLGLECLTCGQYP